MDNWYQSRVLLFLLNKDIRKYCHKNHNNTRKVKEKKGNIINRKGCMFPTHHLLNRSSTTEKWLPLLVGGVRVGWLYRIVWKKIGGKMKLHITAHKTTCTTGQIMNFHWIKSINREVTSAIHRPLSSAHKGLNSTTKTLGPMIILP